MGRLRDICLVTLYCAPIGCKASSKVHSGLTPGIAQNQKIKRLHGAGKAEVLRLGSFAEQDDIASRHDDRHEPFERLQAGIDRPTGGWS